MIFLFSLPFGGSACFFACLFGVVLEASCLFFGLSRCQLVLGGEASQFYGLSLELCLADFLLCRQPLALVFFQPPLLPAFLGLGIVGRHRACQHREGTGKQDEAEGAMWGFQDSKI